MVFNAAISNLDDHPRNHAILAREHGWRLSPAYDLTPFAVVSQQRSLALECGLYGRAANKTNLKNQINAFSAGGCTAGHISIAWAYYMMSSKWNSAWPTGSDAAR